MIDQNQTPRAANEGGPGQNVKTEAPEPNTIVGGEITGWNIER